MSQPCTSCPNVVVSVPNTANNTVVVQGFGKPKILVPGSWNIKKGKT